MVDADTHPSGICGQIIDAIGHRTTELLDQKVVDPDFFRMALPAILAPIVTKIPDQFLLFGVDRDYGLLFGQSRGHSGRIVHPGRGGCRPPWSCGFLANCNRRH